MTKFIKTEIQPPRVVPFFNICDAPVEDFWFDKDQLSENMSQETKDLLLNAVNLSTAYITSKGGPTIENSYLYNLIVRMTECFYMFYNPNARPPGISPDVEPLNIYGTKTDALGLPTRQLEDLPHTECNKFIYTCIITEGYMEMKYDPNNPKYCDSTAVIDAMGDAVLSYIEDFDNLDDDIWKRRLRDVIYLDMLAFIADRLGVLNPGNDFLSNYNSITPIDIYEDVDNKGDPIV